MHDLFSEICLFRFKFMLPFYIIAQGYIQLLMKRTIACSIRGPVDQDMVNTLVLINMPKYFIKPPGLKLTKEMLTGGEFLFGCVLNDSLGTLSVEQFLIPQNSKLRSFRPVAFVVITRYHIDNCSKVFKIHSLRFG